VSEELVLVRKWTDEAFIQDHAPRLQVYVEVVNLSRVSIRAVVRDEVPPEAVPVEAIGFVSAGRELQAAVELGPGERAVLTYTLEFTAWFDGYLPRARVLAGRLEFRSRPVRVKVNVFAPPVIDQLPGGAVGGVQVPVATQPLEPTFDQIAFHEEEKNGLISSIDNHLSVLLYGSDTCLGRLVRAAARYARGKGFRVHYAVDLAYAALSSQVDASTLIAAPDLDELIVNLFLSAAWPRFLNDFKRAVEEGAIVIASMNASVEEFKSRLAELRAANPAIADYLNSVFSVKLKVQPPSHEELKAYVLREAGEYLDDDAKSLEWLSKALPARRSLTCNEAMALVKRLKAAYRAKEARLNSNECAAIIGVALAQWGSGRGQGYHV
jgi:hypothetical protein